jgi:arsenate reductase (thioredoxin)
MTATNRPDENATDGDRLQIAQATNRLAREFDGTFPPETVERYLLDSHARFDRTARVSNWIPILAERLTRDRLRALARLEVGTLDRPAVLFLCVHNAGRSQMAAGWLRHLSGGRVDVFSGGSEPGQEINATAVAAMSEVGIDIASQLPQPWTDEIARSVDVIVTMGCGDVCPVFPGQRYEDWTLTDPAGQPLDVVREVRDEIRARVEALLTTLDVPLERARGGITTQTIPGHP